MAGRESVVKSYVVMDDKHIPLRRKLVRPVPFREPASASPFCATWRLRENHYPRGPGECATTSIATQINIPTGSPYQRGYTLLPGSKWYHLAAGRGWNAWIAIRRSNFTSNIGQGVPGSSSSSHPALHLILDVSNHSNDRRPRRRRRSIGVLGCAARQSCGFGE